MDGYNATDEKIQKIADFLKNINYKTAELLPYHKMGDHKYDALDMECTSYEVPSKEDMEKYKNLF